MKNTLRIYLQPWVFCLLLGILVFPFLSATAENGAVNNNPPATIPTSLTGNQTFSAPSAHSTDTLPPTLNALDNNSAVVPEYVVIRPSEEITYSSEISASVMNENVKEGSKFLTGDVLVQMDCRVQQADLDKALSQQQLSKIAIISAKKLKSYSSISNFEFAQAVAQVKSADADVDKLKAIVDKCTIRAPFNGSVARLMVRNGETIKPGDPLIKIVSTENLDFQMQIPSDWLSWLHVGTKFSVHVNEINQNVPVTVVRINPEIDSVSQTVRITAKTEIDNPMLLPGMSGQARFIR